MTAKLNQIIAIEKGIKSRVHGAVTDLYKVLQKSELFNGFAKTYQKNAEDGEELPSEKKRVQFVAKEVLRDIERNLSELMDVTARKDWTNCSAQSDVVIDGKVLIEGAPVSFLLFLEKQLTDVRTFIEHLPVLDESENWTLDTNSGLYKSDVTQTHRTKKTQRPIVMYDATKEHPAQTQLITEDQLVGFWNQVKQSGAVPKPTKQVLADRVEKLLISVKEARESANMTDANEVDEIGTAVFGYLFKE